MTSVSDLTIGIVIYDEFDDIQKSVSELKNEINHHIQDRHVFWIFILNHPEKKNRETILSVLKKNIATFKYFENPNNNLGLARDIILSRATTELVYFTDPDIEHPHQTLSHLLKLSEMTTTDHNLIGFTGPVIHKSISKPLNEMFFLLHQISKKIPFSFQIQNHTHMNTVDHAPTCHLLLIRKKAVEISGFSNQITSVGEDLDFSHRAYAAGLRYLFSPQASVIHHQNITLFTWVKKVMNFGRAQIMVHKKNKSLPIRFYRLSPLFILCLGFFICFLSGQWQVLFLVFTSVLILLLQILKPAVNCFLLTVFSYAIGELLEIISPRLKLKKSYPQNSEQKLQSIFNDS